MSEQSQIPLRRSQRSVSYPIDGAPAKVKAAGDLFGTMFVHMFLQDVSLSVMPVGGLRRDGATSPVKLEPPNRDVEKLVVSSFQGHSYARPLAEAVCDFLQDCARTVLLYGEACFEIVYLSRPADGRAVAFQLARVTAGTVVRRRGRLVQHLPPAVAAKRKLPDHVELDPKSVIIFEAPQYAKGELHRVVGALGELGTRMLPPEFVYRDLRAGLQQATYDAKGHIRTRNLALASATQLTGWNARNLLLDDTLEFYWMHRQLLFHRFVIELRDGLLATLNEVLRRAGSEIGFSGALRLQGLPTLEDVEAAQDHLRKGDRSFAALLEPFNRSR